MFCCVSALHNVLDASAVDAEAVQHPKDGNHDRVVAKAVRLQQMTVSVALNKRMHQLVGRTAMVEQARTGRRTVSVRDKGEMFQQTFVHLKNLTRQVAVLQPTGHGTLASR